VTAVIVLAKSPSPGRVKTRLCPPYTPAQAAVVAAAALEDTLAAVAASTAERRVLALDGELGAWLPTGWRVVRQRGEGLTARLEAAFRAVGPPALLIGMDTPQITPNDITEALAALGDPSCDAVLGPALDGGYWAIGFRRHVRGAFRGVTMSVATTGAEQLQRLARQHLRVRLLPLMRDVDYYSDALAVADAAPASRFAHAVRAAEVVSAQ